MKFKYQQPKLFHFLFLGSCMDGGGDTSGCQAGNNDSLACIIGSRD